MDLKLEKPKAEPLSYEICRLCLSTERATRGVRTVSYAYGLMTDWAPQSDVAVCWECEATLRRIHAFKLQATRALQLFEEARGEVNSEVYPSLTRLCFRTCNKYDASFAFDIEGDTNGYCGRDNYDEISIVKTELFDSDSDNWADAAILTESFHKPVAKIQSNHSDSMYDKVEPKNLNIIKPKDQVKIKWKASKLELKRGEKGKKRTLALIASFTATDEELSSYRETALLKLKLHKFKCTACIIGFRAEKDLTLHIESCHSEMAGDFICAVCECRFKNEESRDQHRDAHYKLYRCCYVGCDYVHVVYDLVRSHYVVHTSQRGPMQNAFTSKSEIEHDLLLKQINTQNRSYECDYCGKIFELRRQIHAHIKLHILNIVCEVCGKMLATLERLKKHMATHGGTSHRRHECTVCQKRFISNFKLMIHARSHTGERPFKCDDCGNEFICNDDLKRHKVRHNNSNDRTRAKSVKSDFLKQNELSKSKDGTDKFQCNICGKRLGSYSALRMHSSIHSTFIPIPCDECNKLFKNHNNLKVHMKVVHRGEKSHQCSHCGARFSSKTLLTTHQNSHSNERLYKCDQCDLSFKYQSGLWTHNQTHKGEKPHQCTVCGSRFTLKGNLKGHMKTHTNDKPFECNICGKKFPWRRNLMNHVKTHTKEVPSIT